MFSKKCFFSILLLLVVFVPSAVWSQEGGLTIGGFPASTQYCTLEGARQVSAREYLLDFKNQHASPIAGNTFIVVELLVVFKSGDATLSSKDFILKNGEVQFDCAGFLIKTAPDKEPALVWGDEITLSAGGKENFKKTHGRGVMTLVFTGPTTYAKGAMTIKSAYPVKAKLKKKATSPPKASKSDKK
jgi:hypothetical protein